MPTGRQRNGSRSNKSSASDSTKRYWWVELRSNLQDYNELPRHKWQRFDKNSASLCWTRNERWRYDRSEINIAKVIYLNFIGTVKKTNLILFRIFDELDKPVTIRLFPIEYLLFQLQTKCVEIRNADCVAKGLPQLEVPFKSVMMAKDMMSRDQFMYNDIGCNSHIIMDNNTYCCLSKVRLQIF